LDRLLNELRQLRFGFVNINLHGLMLAKLD
jgi:hypothetical protein